jgi:hypothetical protein
MYEVGAASSILRELRLGAIPLKRPPLARCSESKSRGTWKLFMEFKSLGEGGSDVSLMEYDRKYTGSSQLIKGFVSIPKTTVLNSTTPMVVVMAVANSGFFASPEMVNCRKQ